MSNAFEQNKQLIVDLPAPGAATTPNISSITRTEGGWEPAGFNADGSYVVLSRKTGQLVTLRAQDLNEKKLLVLLGRKPREACMVYDPQLRQKVCDPDLLPELIAKACDAMGPFDFGRVRGPGLYREGKQLIINYGDEVLTSDAVPGSTVPRKGGAVYQAGPSLGLSPDTPCASREDVQRVATAVKSFGLRRTSDLVLILGWYAMAFYGQVVNTRPVLALTAERGSGKTTLIELLAQLLGPQAFRRDGVPTTAQVIYELKSRSAALLADEVEARGSKKAAIEELLEIFRIGFTNSSEHRMSRVSGGKMSYFNAPTGALVAGIGLPAFNSATESRTVRVCLDVLPDDSRKRYEPLFDSARQDETRELGARVRQLLLARWPVMCGAMEQVRAMLLALGHEARMADKFATLIAGYVALMHEAVPSSEETLRLIESLELTVPQRESVERDSDACLRVLLDRKVVIYRLLRNERSKGVMTIREVIQEVIHGEDGQRQSLVQQLEQFGVRPMWIPGAASWKLAVCTSEQHQGMRRLMQGTDWALGGWRDVLSRLPGAEPSVQKVARTPQRVMLLDMPSELLEPVAEEVYDFPEPQELGPGVRSMAVLE